MSAPQSLSCCTSGTPITSPQRLVLPPPVFGHHHERNVLKRPSSAFATQQAAGEAAVAKRYHNSTTAVERIQASCPGNHCRQSRSRSASIHSTRRSQRTCRCRLATTSTSSSRAGRTTTGAEDTWFRLPRCSAVLTKSRVSNSSTESFRAYFQIIAWRSERYWATTSSRARARMGVRLAHARMAGRRWRGRMSGRSKRGGRVREPRQGV